MAEEKFLTLNIRKLLVKKQNWRRSEVAVFLVKKFLKRHLKTDKIKISQKLNELIWKRGIKRPKTKIKVKAVKEGEEYKVDVAS